VPHERRSRAKRVSFPRARPVPPPSVPARGAPDGDSLSSQDPPFPPRYPVYVCVSHTQHTSRKHIE
jgi:hypothetical protein